MSTDWEGLYQKGDTGWDKGEASPGLVDFLAARPELPRGTVLIPGCGRGHDVRAWAEYGFDATGFDLAPSAVRESTERIAKESLTERARVLQGNFLEDEPITQFDWLFEHTLYCAIQPSQRDAYAAAAARWLKPGGQFFAIHYLIPDTEGPPFGCTRDEVVKRFESKFELLGEWTPRSYPNRTNLELALWWKRR